MSFHYYFDAEIDRIYEYENGELTYEEVYVLCFKIARQLSQGWNW